MRSRDLDYRKFEIPSPPTFAAIAFVTHNKKDNFPYKSLQMKIFLAQIQPVKGDVEQNIARHISFIERAAAFQAAAIFFPELSLTGYEPGLAQELATTADDKRFAILQKWSDQHLIIIAAGIPLLTSKGIQISMLIFKPQQPVQTYAKQILHTDEAPYFVSGDNQILIRVGSLKIAPAICYESLQPGHAEKAKLLGADLYVASVAKSPAAVTKAYGHYPQIAATYGMPVLMANSVGPSDNFISAGQSGVWSKNGALLGQLNDTQEGLLRFDTSTEEVSAHFV